MGCLFRIVGVTLLLLLTGSNSQEIPDLPNYFSGYIESQTTVEGTGIVVQSVAKEYFDGTVELSRSDTAADVLYPEASGVLTAITDPTHKVQYFIQRETRNCSVETLAIAYGGGGIVISPDGSLHFRSINNLFYLVNASEYTYAGNFSAHGVVLDNWTYTGNIELPNVSYHDVTLELSIARNGAPSTSGSNMGPVPWRISVSGNITVNGAYNASISSVSRLFDMSFVEPHYDVFDVSLCSEPKDYEVLGMSVPKGPNKMVNYSSFTKNVRQAIVTYTQVAPIQVGNIEIFLDTGSALYVSVQISNMTAKATNVKNPVTAAAAYTNIYEHITNDGLPFQIDIGSGNMVTPKALDVKVIDSPTSASTMPIQSISMATPDASIMPSPMATPDASIMPSPMTTSIMPSPSPMTTSSMPSPTTTTVTVTVTPSNCPSVFVSPTSVPASGGKAYSQGYVVGLALGMIILGAAVALLSVFLGVCLYSRFGRKMSMRTGYERQVNVNTN